MNELAQSETDVFRPARILIIEDEPVIAADIEASLKEAGYDVVAIAATAKEAYSNFLEYRPDLVTVDLQLADGYSGLEVVNRMLAVRNVPTVFVTAFPERLLTDERPETTLLIVKPFHGRTLQTAVAQALAQHPVDIRGIASGAVPSATVALSDLQLAPANAQPTPAQALKFAVASATAALSDLQRARPREEAESRYGHNGPPADAGLPEDALEVAADILRRLASIPETVPGEVGELEVDKQRLVSNAEQIVNWASSKVAEGFLNKIGENLADPKTWFGMWLVFSGELTKVVAALTHYLNSLR